MSEKFCLKWNDFENNVSKSFGLLRNEEYLHDVTLLCDDNSQVSAHKLVLSACSEIFKTIFKNHRHQNTLICLEGVTPNDLENILDYMYIGETNVFQENLDKFLSIAQRLKVLGLLQKETDEEGANDSITKNSHEEIEKPYQNANYKEDVIPPSMANGNSRKVKKEHSSGSKERSLAINGNDQNEIRQSIDMHLEICDDGSLKCTICGKTDKGNRASGKSLMRCHIETHIEGLSYQGPLCDKTFRSVNSLRAHKSRFHK